MNDGCLPGHYYGSYGDNNLDEIGLRILRHAACELYFEHGKEKAAINPNVITFFDRKAEVLGLACMVLVQAMQRINNGKEHN